MRLLYDRLTVYMKHTAYAPSLAGAVVFQNHDALRAVVEEGAEVETLPAFTPPYPKVFIEVHLPFYFKKDVYAGVLIEAVDCPDGELPEPIAPLKLADTTPPRWLLFITTYIDPKAFPKRLPFARGVMVLDRAGRPIALATDEHPEALGLVATALSAETEPYVQIVYDVAADLIERGSMERFAEQLTDAALFTLGLLHVKNVEVVDQQPNRQESRKFQKHYGQPLTTFKVLRIAGKGGSAGATIGARGDGSRRGEVVKDYAVGGGHV